MLKRLDADECRYAYLSPSELATRLSAKSVLYFPIGSLEWHNEHLPLGTDTFESIGLCMRLCREIGGVMLPGFWWNTGGCHDHAATYHMPEPLYRATLKNVILGLKPIPAKLLVLVNGHGGGHQMRSPAIIAEEINREGFPIRVIVADVYCLGDSGLEMDHADTAETSFAMDVIPQLVRMDRPVGPDLLSHQMPFAAGRPSREAGQKWWDAYFKYASEMIARNL